MVNGEASSDPSLSDILLRHAATEEEMRAIVRVLRHWSNTDPQSFPAQLAVVTLAQWYAAASILGEVERLLEVYRDALQAACETVDAAIAGRLEAFASAQDTYVQAAKDMKVCVYHLYKLAEGAEKHLSRCCSMSEIFFRDAHERLEEEIYRRTHHLFIWALLCGIMFTVIFGFAVWVWSGHSATPANSERNNTSTAVELP